MIEKVPELCCLDFRNTPRIFHIQDPVESTRIRNHLIAPQDSRIITPTAEKRHKIRGELAVTCHSPLTGPKSWNNLCIRTLQKRRIWGGYSIKLRTVIQLLELGESQEDCSRF